MRKQLGVLTSLLFFCATALCWVGCGFGNGGNNCCYYNAETECANPCCESYSPEESCRTRDCGRTTRSQITCDGVEVIAHQPDMCLLGDQYCMDIDVHAHRDVCEVTLSTTLPEGVDYVKSEPPAFQDGAKLVWSVGHLKAGCCQRLRICLRCEREGPLEACFCVSATPVAFCTIMCAKPVLCCSCCGPEEACPGDCLEYNICVGNRGTCVARDVRVLDNLPEGLETQQRHEYADVQSR